MREVTINRLRGNILSLLLYVVGVISGIAINFFFIQIESFKVDAMVIVTFLLIAVFHELTHFFGYSLIAGVAVNEISFIKDRKFDLPYFKTKKYIEKNSIIITLILPAIITSVLVVMMNVMSGNLAYTLLLGISLALSGADFEMAIQLAKSDSNVWKSCDREFGFINSN